MVSKTYLTQLNEMLNDAQEHKLPICYVSGWASSERM